MRKVVGFAGVLLLFAALAGAQEQAAVTNEAAVFKAKADELIKGKPARIEKLAAIQAFVRDEIAQAPTQYG